MLSNAPLQVEQSPDGFTPQVRSLEKTPGERTVDLTCPRSLVQALQRERQARIDALRAARMPVRSRALANS